MGFALRCALVGLLLAAPAAAEERLAVLEFFGRPQGTYCRAAGPAMLALQAEMAGRAVLLEYDYDVFPTGRADRWWASGISACCLPLVMVGSGYATCFGPVEYEEEYRTMILAELARAPQAGVAAFWRRVGNGLRAYVRVENRGAATLSPAEEASIWVIAYEEARIGVSSTWVRAAVTWPLTQPLPPGGQAQATIDVPSLAGADWSHLAAVALLEYRPGRNAPYDMLNSAIADPAALTAVPGAFTLTAAEPSGGLALAGPHVLSWTAASDVPWLTVTPSAGTLPATVSIGLAGDPPRWGTRLGHVTFTAVGDGMTFAEVVSVTAAGAPRRSRRVVRRPGS